MRMQAVRETSKEMSLNKALQYCGMFKHAWYYAKKPRDVPVNTGVAYKARKIFSKQPTCGIRRMAARVCTLPGCRGRSGKGICRLQQGQDSFRIGISYSRRIRPQIGREK